MMIGVITGQTLHFSTTTRRSIYREGQEIRFVFAKQGDSIKLRSGSIVQDFDP
jgi:hypothetical protein